MTLINLVLTVYSGPKDSSQVIRPSCWIAAHRGFTRLITIARAVPQYQGPRALDHLERAVPRLSEVRADIRWYVVATRLLRWVSAIFERTNEEVERAREGRTEMIERLHMAFKLLDLVRSDATPRGCGVRAETAALRWFVSWA